MLCCRLCSGTGALCTQPASYQMTNPVPGGSWTHHQSVCKPHAVGQPSKQMMVNTRIIQKDSLPPASDRGSILEELQRQLLSNTGGSLASVRTYADKLRQNVVRPVAVKAESSVEFHPLMSGIPHVPPVVLPSTASGRVDLTALYSASIKREQDSLSHFRLTRSPQDLMLSSSSTSKKRPWHPHEMHQPETISQPAYIGSPDQSSVRRLYSTAGTSEIGSLCSPTGQSSSLAADTQHAPLAAWPSAHSSPVHSYQSHNYISPQLGAGSSMYVPLPHCSTQSRHVQSANRISPRHRSPRQHPGITSPGRLFQPSCSQISPYHIPPPNATSAVDLTTRRQTSSVFRHDLGLPASHCSIQRSATGLMNYRIRLPVESVLPRMSCPQQQVSRVPVTKPLVNQQPRLSSAASLRQTSSTSSRNRSFYLQPSSTASVGTAQKNVLANTYKNVSVTPSAAFSATISPSKLFVHGSVDFDSLIETVKPITLQQNSFVEKLGPQQNQTVKEINAFVEKPIKLKRSQTVTKSESEAKKATSTVSAGVKRKLDGTSTGTATDSKPKLAQRFGDTLQEYPAKKTLDHGTCTEADSKPKVDKSFVDKYEETVAIRGLVDNAEVDSSETKRSVPAPKKESKVCIVNLV